MKVDKKETEPCVLELSVSAEAAEIQAEYKKALNLFVRNGVIPGFRKGKAPVAIVQQKFKQDIDNEAIKVCFQKLYPEVIKQADVDVLVLQGLTQAVINPETGFNFTALVEVKPEFTLPKYKKLAIKSKKQEVTDENVSKRVEDIRSARAKYEDAKEGAVIGDGDFVCFDYKGMLGNKPLIEVVPDQKAICEATGFWVQVEEGRFLKEILEALKGMKAGESKNDVTVKFPKKEAPDGIKGKTVIYEITVKSFRSRQLPDDAALLEAEKAESMDALRTKIHADLEKEADEADLSDRRDQAVELLLKKADFAVPPSLVQQQQQNFLQDFARRAQYSGLPADYFEKNREQIMQDAADRATRQVRLSYILDGIATAEKIEISEADKDERIAKIAESSYGRTTAEALKKQLVDENRMDGLVDQLRAEHALDLVLAEAKK